MKLNFHFIFERDGDFYIGYCPEVPEANGQGYTLEECRQSLEDAIELVLQDRSEQALSGYPEEAKRELVTLE
jgi:predicted RNase H-like HicB family nuclease